MFRSLRVYKNNLIVLALFIVTAYLFVAKNQFSGLNLSISSGKQTKREENCGRFPEGNDIKIDNEMWQV